MSTEKWITGWQKRLVAMAKDPPYEIVDTPQELIDKNFRRMTEFEGWPEAEISATEDELGVRFPPIFRAFLLAMGKNSGDLFEIEDFPVELSGFAQFKADALALIKKAFPEAKLPKKAVVFKFNEGYAFHFFTCSDKPHKEPPVRWWAEFNEESTRVQPSFAAWMDEYLEAMEDRHRELHQNGAKLHRTLYPEGAYSEVYASPPKWP